MEIVIGSLVGTIGLCYIKLMVLLLLTPNPMRLLQNNCNPAAF